MEGERNYHVFYQMLAGATDEERAEWQLGPPESFYYLSQSVGRHVIRVVGSSSLFTQVAR